MRVSIPHRPQTKESINNIIAKILYSYGSK